MSFEKALQEMIRRELDGQLAPLQKSIVRLERGLSSLQAVREVTAQLAPLLGEQGRQAALRLAQARASAQLPTPAAQAPAAPVARSKAGASSSGSKSCAVIGCKRPSRSKGYCSAHYQKLRLLIRTGRRPKDWGDDAPPQSARDVKLPRGRAAAKERPAAPAAPREPPKPKAWVRKKGGSGMVSLH